MTDTQTRTWVGVAAALLALVVAVCAGLLVGQQLGAGSTPSNDSVDAGFARDMQVHHAQAVEMSYAVTLVTEDPAVRQIAYDILTTQQAQVGMMRGWLEEWDLPAYSSAPVMAWMGGVEGHGAHGGGLDGMDEMEDMAEFEPHDGAIMPGMATDAEMEQLRSSSGRAAEILFLQLMIHHHRAGVEMAQYAADHAADEDVRSHARRMAQAQTAEVDAMNAMLEERGAEPV